MKTRIPSDQLVHSEESSEPFWVIKHPETGFYISANGTRIGFRHRDEALMFMELYDIDEGVLELINPTIN